MRKLSYYLLFLCLMAQSLSAQDLLVKTNGDSLIGKVGIARDHRNNEYAAFRNGKKKESVKLLAIRQVKMENGDVYKPVQAGNKIMFGKLIREGYLSYYKVTGDGLSEMFTADLLTKMDGTNVVISGKIGFKGRVSKFLNDCVQVSYDVKEKKYDRYQLDQIVRDYNACVNVRGLTSNDALERRAEELRVEKSEETKELEKSLEDKLADFGSLLSNSKKVENKEDVTAMFNDVAGKLRRNESVPNYLKSGLQEAIKNDPDLANLLAEILQKSK